MATGLQLTNAVRKRGLQRWQGIKDDNPMPTRIW